MADVSEEVLTLLSKTIQTWLLAEQSRTAMRQRIALMLREIEAGTTLILAYRNNASSEILQVLQKAYDQAVLERKAYESSTDASSASPNSPASPG